MNLAKHINGTRLVGNIVMFASVSSALAMKMRVVTLHHVLQLGGDIRVFSARFIYLQHGSFLRIGLALLFSHRSLDLTVVCLLVATARIVTAANASRHGT